MSKKKEKKNDDFLAQESKEAQETAQEYTLDIPEDEIWTYHIEGLQAPHINKPFKNAKIKKIVVVIVLIFAIGAAMYFSVRAVHADEYSYKELDDGTYELIKYTNPGGVKDITIDYVVDLETGEKDTSKPITKIHEYAFNCDETLNSITFGKDVKEIDGKSIYSCWWVRDVFVDEENPYFCDLDGVLYNKDLTKVIHYPCDHDKSLRLKLGYNVNKITVEPDGRVELQNTYFDKEKTKLEDTFVVSYDKNNKELDKFVLKDKTITKDTLDDYITKNYLKIDSNGFPLKDDKGNYLQPELISKNTFFEDDGRLMEELWGTTDTYDEAYYQNYNREVRTYVIPSSVEEIGELAFAYSNIVDLYIPEGVKTMENMAIFKNTVLVNIYSYKSDQVISDTTFKAMDQMSEIYSSLPEGLEFIGSDCMYYLRGLNYMYIPSSVTTIKHHAFWDAVYKENDELKGVTAINTAYRDESEFDAKVTTGDQWRPQYDYMLFKKSIDVNYGVARESQYNYNVHRQYYWAVQWVINHNNQDGSAYLVKDFNNDGTPELVLREFNKDAGKLQDTILTFRYGYLDAYEGDANYGDSDFSKLDDNTQLDSIFDTVK